MRSRCYECQDPECRCLFEVFDIWCETSLKCPLCQGPVKQQK